MTDSQADPIAVAQARLLYRSIPWHTASGYAVVLIVLWHYLAVPIINAVLFIQGQPQIPPQSGLSVGDAMALVGLPLAGVIGQKFGGN